MYFIALTLKIQELPILKIKRKVFITFELRLLLEKKICESSKISFEASTRVHQ